MAFFDFNKIGKKEYDTKIVTISNGSESYDFKIQAIGGLKYTQMIYNTTEPFERIILLLQYGTLKEEKQVDSEGRESFVFVPAFENRAEIEAFIEAVPIVADRLAGEISIFSQESFAEFHEAKKNMQADSPETTSSQSDDNTVDATV